MAYKMAKDDDLVDALFAQIIRELFSLMVENPKTVCQAICSASSVVISNVSPTTRPTSANASYISLPA